MKFNIKKFLPDRLRTKLIVTALYLLYILIAWRIKIPCVYLYFLGISCPGCGMTRAWLSVLHLDFYSAFNFNPMFWSVPIVYLYILYDGKLFKIKWLDRLILKTIGAGFALLFIYRLFFN